MPSPGFPRTPKSKSKRSVGVILIIAAAALAYIAITYCSVSAQAVKDEARPVDVIVVFGAAEYAGRPSPAFRARLDHALDIYRQGIAPFIITTGGKGDVKFTEGGVGRDYLVAAGVPDAKVIAETQSEDTSESAQRVATIMRANNMNTCVAVSDGYHIYRIKRMMMNQGMETYGSPRLGGNKTPFIFLREVASITLWRLHIT
jgi:uncharacterized SAM-binding protein YcdF (DUF218 family)